MSKYIGIAAKYIIFATSVMLMALPTQAFQLSPGEPWAAGEATFHTSPLSTTGSGLTSTELRDAFIDAMNEWTTKSNFDYLPTTGSAEPCVTPSTNVNNNSNGYTFDDHVCFDEDGNEVAFQAGTLAVAVTWHLGSMGEGPTIQSGIVFNSNSNWNIYTGNGSGFDFRRVAIHELGHSLGLAHTSVTPAIMLPVVGDLEEPQSDDLEGVEEMYGVFDSDGDGIGDNVDNCPDDDNADQADFNNDGEGDVCDNSDDDSFFDDVDNCPLVDNEDQLESGSYLGIGIACDLDDDGVRADVDNCLGNNNPNQSDIDNDEIGDACDSDVDGDGVDNGADDDFLNKFICSDVDGDDVDPNLSCDDCSSGTFDPNNDGPDADNDGLCDAFEEDDDNDGVDDDFPDNCPTIPNPLQEDSDDDGIGDACEEDELCFPIKASNNNLAVICL